MNADPPIPDELWQQIPPTARAAILALIQQYEQRLAELEARLNQNSTNSSKPPSSDPPARASASRLRAGIRTAERTFKGTVSLHGVANRTVTTRKPPPPEGVGD